MILVTGASGFLGLHLLETLIKQGIPIRALYFSKKPEYVHPLIEWVYCNLLDVYEVEDVMQGVELVYHCAAVVSFDKKDRERVIEQNRATTANVVNEALNSGVKKLLFVSSIAALGRMVKDKNTIDEETQWEDSANNSSYAIGKYLSEMEVWRGFAEGLPIVIVNPGIILGEGDYSKGSAHLFQSVYDGLPYYTEGVNGWVDVKDVVEAMAFLMNSGIVGERFILIEGNYSYKYIFEQMALGLDKKPPTQKVSPFLGSVIWRLIAIKNLFSNKKSSITNETAKTAQTKCFYSNEKLLTSLPKFSFTPMDTTINRISKDFLNNV
ncbi:MAG TPA: NAD-dependent epimerase/dehydratase family protein [Edaphocola sp.]|nr:NAD-dependent epimerase/dehydratase family protein [Edaphocola sp.]